jgi:hypothetical protein
VNTPRWDEGPPPRRDPASAAESLRHAALGREALDVQPQQGPAADLAPRVKNVPEEGFHHHGTLAIAAYGFLISERERIPPSGPRSAARIEKSPLPSVYRPRGAPDPAAAPRPQLDQHDPSRASRRDCKQTSEMPALCAPHSQQSEIPIVPGRNAGISM